MLVCSAHAVAHFAPFDHSNSPLTGNVRVVPVSRVDAWAILEILSFDPRASSLPTLGGRAGFVDRIEVMSSSVFACAETCLEQVYLMERDAGLLCRILGLYSARDLNVVHMDYSYAAQHVMKLSVRVGANAEDRSQVADTVRVLVAKAATFIGVIAAAEHPGVPRAFEVQSSNSDA
jgi:hypothetical protein